MISLSRNVITIWGSRNQIELKLTWRRTRWWRGQSLEWTPTKSGKSPPESDSQSVSPSPHRKEHENRNCKKKNRSKFRGWTDMDLPFSLQRDLSFFASVVRNDENRFWSSRFGSHLTGPVYTTGKFMSLFWFVIVIWFSRPNTIWIKTWFLFWFT